MAQYIPAIRPVAPNALYIVTEHEPGVVAADSRGEHLPIRRRLGNLIRYRAWRRYERNTLSTADAVITFSAYDRDIVSAMVAASTIVSCIPLRLFSDFTPSAEQHGIPSDLLFVGAFRHPPNADAAMRLVTSIFPSVRRRLRKAQLLIVGADPPPALVSEAPTGLTFTGLVEDVSPYLVGASIVICPLRLGGGMRVKILEACAYGKPLIASPQAVQGLDLRPDREFVVARTDEEFAERAIDLLTDPARRSRLARAAREWAMRTQNSEQWAAEYDVLYQRLSTSGSDRRGRAGL